MNSIPSVGKKNILFITLSTKNTLDNSIHRYILQELQKRFDTVTVFCWGKRFTESDANITYHSGNFWNWLIYLKRLNDIGVVYINDFFVGGLFGLLAKKTKKAQMVFRCGSPWKYDGRSISALFKTAIVMFTRPIAIKSCKRVVYNSRSIVQKRYEHQWKVIYNGVDTNLFNLKDYKDKNNKSQEDNQKLRALFIGRIRKEKGIDYLLEATEQIKDLVSISLIGDGPLFPKYQREFPHALFKGRVKNNDLPEIIRDADVIILPSLTKSSESFPNVLLEAMACGKPVIGTNVWGIPEIIDNRVNGLRIVEKDTPAIIEALNVIKDPLLREQMGQRAREKIVRSFEINKQIKDLCNYLLSED